MLQFASFVVNFQTLTNTQPHIHTLFLISHAIQVRQFRRYEMANNCWNLWWTESLFSLWQLVATATRGRGKLPAFSIKFCTRASRKFLCVLSATHDVTRRNILTIVKLAGRKKGFFSTSMSTIGLSNCWSFCHLCQCTPYAGYGPAESVASKHFHFHHKSYLLLLVDCAHLSHIHVMSICPDHCCQVMSCPGPNIATFRSFILY
jgi:hypothetical protein